MARNAKWNGCFGSNSGPSSYLKRTSRPFGYRMKAWSIEGMFSCLPVVGVEIHPGPKATKSDAVESAGVRVEVGRTVICWDATVCPLRVDLSFDCLELGLGAAVVVGDSALVLARCVAFEFGGPDLFARQFSIDVTDANALRNIFACRRSIEFSRQHAHIFLQGTQ